MGRVFIDVQKAVDLYNSGMGVPAIAKEFGCSATAVRNRLVDAGVTFRNGGTLKAEVDDAEIVRLFTEGVAQVDIAAALGTSMWVVSRRLKKHGLTRQTKKRRNIDLPIDEMAERYEAGDTLAEIADTFGCSRETVKRRLVAVGCIDPTEEPPEVKRCEWCGAEFKPASKRLKYCPKCSKAHRGHKHNFRAQMFGVEYESGITWRTLSERLGHCDCEICGEPCDPHDRSYGTCGPLYPTVDCIVPLSKGGGYTWDNVQLAHFACNVAKSNKTKKAVQHAEHDRSNKERHAAAAASTAGTGDSSVNRHRGRKPQHGTACQAVPRDDTRDSRAARGCR